MSGRGVGTGVEWGGVEGGGGVVPSLHSASVRVPPSDILELLFQINFQIVTLKVYQLYVTCKIHTSCIDSANISLFMTSYGRIGDHSLSHR